MNQFRKLFSGAWSILVVCTLAFAMAGCEGDDGAQGPAGPQGPVGDTGPAGPAGEDASVLPLESCGVCHGVGAFGDAVAAHAVTGIAAVSDVAFLGLEGGDLEVSFTLATDGVAVVDPPAVDSAYVYTAADSTTIRVDLEANPITVAAGVDPGDFVATIPGGVALAGDAARFFLRLGMQGIVSGDFPAVALPNVASNDSCTNCHGPKGLTIHAGFGYPGMEASECVTCHKDQAGIWAPDGVPRFEDSFVGIVHGIHSAHDLPGGAYFYGEDRFDTTYPTYMVNCSVCHSPDEIAVGELTQLAAANAMQVSGAGCLSCHGAMENDVWDFSGGLSFHLDIEDPLAANCGGTCHAPAPDGAARYLVTQFHNGAETGRGGIIFDGVDTSVEEGKKFDWQITDIVDDGVNLAISWTASYEGVGVDPCNDTVGAGAPVFHAGDGSIRIYRSYAQGDDFIMGASTSAPGQPARVNVTVDNTACAAGIATTTIPVEAMDAEKGRIVLGGKPLIESALLDPPAIVEARVPTPTYDWLLGDGEMVARRGVVDTDLCLDCHVGSLYQHGGDRVDNVDMCLVCHNEASNEQNVRVGMGVDASEAYDGQVGENYGMKTMLHRIHSANWEFEDGRYNDPYLVYRNRGIYAFARDVSDVPNWDPTVVTGCTEDEIARGRSRVFGSSDDSADKCEVHNFHAPTYPRLLNDCAGCHVDGFSVIPDQTKSMATTIDAGSTDWANQLDDVLQGAGTTACITCHADFATKGHAYQNSWVPQDFPMGRQTIIDAVN